MGTTLRALGVSDSCKPTGAMECVYISHGWPFDEHDRVVEADKQPYEVNGKQYLITDAHFLFGVNKKDGVLIAFSRSGPAYTEAGKKTPQNIADLEQASDMAWESLMRYMSVSDASKLRYFISVSIANELTQRIISKSTNKEGAPTKWPGKSFTMDTEEGHALLARKPKCTGNSPFADWP
ncbi:hypothetical protein BS50DRAFT_578943 [Corynespora cassiicola Philippines]|uniref:Uncharacterized protein n=1 Tax=Corynespora cassiicola Philippines TaxID=1448308 RepID=A0A2T2N5T4_CORCC|nr:hypothetical protein BS50DRAFT_578943 [Corynespora cassiicola Philippines]